MRHFFLFTLLILISFNLFSQDQIPNKDLVFGLRGGGNHANMIFDNSFNYDETKPLIGFNAGLFARLEFMNAPFEVEMCALYSRKGSKPKKTQVSLDGYDEDFELNRKIQLNYLDIPLFINITSGRKSKNTVYIGGGIMVSTGIKGTLNDNLTSKSYEINTSNEIVWDDAPNAHFHVFDLSFTGQFGLRTKKGYGINLSFSQSLANINPNDKTTKNYVVSLSLVKSTRRQVFR